MRCFCGAITNTLQCSAFHCYFHYKNTLQYKCNAMLCFSLHCTLQQEKIHCNTNAMFCVSLYITADALVYKSIVNHWLCFFIWSFTSFNSFTPVHICRKNQLIHTGILSQKIWHFLDENKPFVQSLLSIQDFSAVGPITAVL